MNATVEYYFNDAPTVKTEVHRDYLVIFLQAIWDRGGIVLSVV